MNPDGGQEKEGTADRMEAVTPVKKTRAKTRAELFHLRHAAKQADRQKDAPHRADCGHNPPAATPQVNTREIPTIPTPLIILPDDA